MAAAAKGACDEAVTRAVECALGHQRGPLLVPMERRGRPQLLQTLRSLGFSPGSTVVFERRYEYSGIAVPALDAAVYPSSSAVRAAFEDPLGSGLVDVPAISIGPLTSAELRRCGARFIEEAAEDTVSAVVSLTQRMLATQSMNQEPAP